MGTGQNNDANSELLGAETRVEQRTGLRGPTGWWIAGLIVLALLVAAVLVPQLSGGGTAVIPGTPVAAPANGVSSGPVS